MSSVADSASSVRTSGRPRSVGIDRATVVPSLLVLALALLMSVVLPAINRAAPYRHPVQRGEIAELAAGLSMAPTPGWDLVTGAIVGHTRSLVGDTATTELIDGGVTFDVQAAPVSGSPSALLRRVREISAKLDRTRGSATATRTYPVRTRQGAAGVGQDFVGVSREGSVVAFVLRMRGQTSGEGVEVVAAGPKARISRAREEIVAMIRSLRTTP